MTDTLLQHLLRAALAEQLGFFDRERLVRLFPAAVAPGEAADRLRELERELDESTVELLDSVAAEHVRREGSVEASLTSLQRMGSMVTTDVVVSTDGVQATLPFLASGSQAESRGSDANGERSLSGHATGRYHVIRAHAEGGLGQVSLAHDAELSRDVALKELKPEHADQPANQARFVAEAEITGALEHPGVVPVYGLGQSADGRPYYAMRFIEGDSLKEAVERFYAHPNRRLVGDRWLDLRKLLGRFVDVCNAIAYAHSRGVLHRDLKPGNIMLGQYGETLVVDWGLAKVLGESAGARPGGDESAPNGQRKLVQVRDSWRTLHGSVAGTPAFMSPEQADGRIDELGAATDIYSLGATLYVLLTGRPPFAGNDLTTVLDQVRSGRFATPRSVQPDLPKPLEAICLKAMARDANDRYATADELAADVERWMADEPVSAYRDSTLERASRMARRHRSWTLAGAAALVAVTLVSTVALGFVDRARRNEQTALANTKRALAAEQQARGEARSAVDNYVDVVTSEAVLERAELQPLRQRLLGDARQYYLRVVKLSGQEWAGRLEGARALSELGKVNRSTGEYREALEAFQQAVTLLETLQNERPAEFKSLDLLAEATNNTGVVLLELQQTSAAAERFERAIAIQEQCVAQDDSVASRVLLASGQLNLATIFGRLGRNDESERLRDQVVAALEAAARTNPHPEYQRILVGARINQGLHLTRRGELQAAMARFKAAIAAMTQVIEQRPTIENRRQLNVAYAGLVEAQRRRKEPAHAATLEKLLAAARELADEAPTQTDVQMDYASALSDYGRVVQDRGDRDAARLHFLDARRVFQRLVKLDPEPPEYWVSWARTCFDMGMLALNEDLDESVRHFEKAVELLKHVVKEHPQITRYREALEGYHQNVAMTLLRAKRYDAAAAHFERSTDQQQKLVEMEPDVPRRASRAAQNLSTLAHLLLQIGQLEKALAKQQKAIALLTAVLEQQPSDEHEVNLARFEVHAGSIYMKMEDQGNAFKAFQAGLKRYAAVVERQPTARARRLYADGLYTAAYAYHAAERLEEARDLARRAVPLLEQLAKEAPQDASIRGQLKGARSIAAAESSP